MRSDVAAQLGGEFGNDKLIEADSFSVGFAFESDVKRPRQTDDKPAALRRSTFDHSERVDGIAEELADSLVFLRLKESLALFTGRVSGSHHSVDRIKKRIGEIGPRFHLAG